MPPCAANGLGIPPVLRGAVQFSLVFAGEVLGVERVKDLVPEANPPIVKPLLHFDRRTLAMRIDGLRFHK
jgi:hypothetical protein